ncbi:hypothetical protein HanIR_Chr15g0779061 [Helianthus annuus]|nr:hypothetical protein HanIR_Chr15g0779061 [Helianthus annuus]
MSPHFFFFDVLHMFCTMRLFVHESHGKKRMGVFGHFKTFHSLIVEIHVVLEFIPIQIPFLPTKHNFLWNSFQFLQIPSTKRAWNFEIYSIIILF